MVINDNVKACRAKSGLVLAEVAERLGVSKSTVQAWEASQRDIPLEHIEKLCALYGVRPLDLLGDLPSREEVECILDKRIADRSYRESFIAAFSHDIQKEIVMKEMEEVVGMYKALPEDVRKECNDEAMRQAEEIQRQYDFMQRHRIMERFGGSVGADTVRKLQEEYGEGGRIDDDILFSFHAMNVRGKAWFLFNVICMLSDPELLQDLGSGTGKAAAYTARMLQGEREGFKEGWNTEGDAPQRRGS